MIRSSCGGINRSGLINDEPKAGQESTLRAPIGQVRNDMDRETRNIIEREELRADEDGEEEHWWLIHNMQTHTRDKHISSLIPSRLYTEQQVSSPAQLPSLITAAHQNLTLPGAKNQTLLHTAAPPHCN